MRTQQACSKTRHTSPFRPLPRDESPLILTPCWRAGQLVVVPSYFDFVRVRNFLAEEGADFAGLHEYASVAELARGRSLFADSRCSPPVCSAAAVQAKAPVAVGWVGRRCRWAHAGQGLSRLRAQASSSAAYRARSLLPPCQHQGHSGVCPKLPDAACLAVTSGTSSPWVHILSCAGKVQREPPGAQELVFYSLPHSAACHSEVVGMMASPAAGQAEARTGSALVLFTHFDAIKLAAVVGSARSRRMLKSQTSKHMFC